MNLIELGWNDFFAAHFNEYEDKELIPGRIVKEFTHSYSVLTDIGEFPAEVTGRFRHEAHAPGDYPAAGDWVLLKPTTTNDKAMIHVRLPRQSFFSRKAVRAGGVGYGPGRTEEQVLAANIDTVFLVAGLDGDCNPRRLERYLMVAWNSGAQPVVVLNKADVCEQRDLVVQEIEAIALGVPVHLTSATGGDGVSELRQYTAVGQTVAFIGSSGVGKSTLINSLIGFERMPTGEVREDDKRGRHTTTHRELIPLPGGGMLLDTPGMREIQAWGDEGGLKRTFEDVEAFTGLCRFRDCRHQGEPGCAIAEAIEAGDLARERFESYQKLKRERKIMAVRKDQRAKMDVFGKRMKKYNKVRGRSGGNGDD
jgi:ribosome biogenesis GTPase / thiamine phosphate phosphatase